MNDKGKINILFVLPNFDTGGSEKLVVDLVTYLNKDKFNPVVCTFFSGVYEKKMLELGIPFYVVHQNGQIKNKIKIVKFLNAIVRRHKIDVVNTHHTSALLQGLPSFKLFNQTKLIHTEHSRLDCGPNIAPKILRIQKIFMKYVDVALGISQGVCDYFRDEMGVPERKIVRILNGVNLSRFRFDKQEGLRIRRQYRKELGITNEDVIIGMFANFRIEKNHLLLLKAIKLMKDRGAPNVKVILAGDGPERQNIEKVIKDMRLVTNVLCLGMRNDIPELMNMIDIYCLPSHFEGLPFSLIEAFAAGKQVVATDVIGNRDVVREVGQGVLIEPNNPYKLAQAIQDEIYKLQYHVPMNLKYETEFLFSAEHMIEKYEDLFSKFNSIEKNALAYHGIIANEKDLLPWRKGKPQSYDLDTNCFEQQMVWLAKNNNDIQLTFDDGEENNFINAFPILKKFLIKARFFIIAEKIGQAGYMNADQLQQMVREGMIIGSHSLSHCILTELDNNQLTVQLKESKAILERIIGKSVDELSIPMGFCDRRVLDFADKAGYSKIFVSDFCPKGYRNCLRRIVVKRGWTMDYFKKIVNGYKPTEDRLKLFIKTILSPRHYRSFRNLIVSKKWA